MQEATELFEVPEQFIFSLKDVTYSPETPRMNEPFIVKGSVALFTIPFLALLWVVAKVTYPEKWWDIIGVPSIAKVDIALGGNFEVTFPEGFEREGEYTLEIMVYGGPTFPISALGKTLLMLPPFPSVTSLETTFTVSGEVTPPEEVWGLVEEISGIVVEPSAPVTVWEMVEEIVGIVVEPAPEVAVWEMVEEVSGIVIEVAAAPPIEDWELVQEVSGIVVEVEVPAIQTGTFFVSLIQEQVAYLEWFAKWEAEGELPYVTAWAPYGQAIEIGEYEEEYGEYTGRILPVPLVGRLTVYLWLKEKPLIGDQIAKYGPSHLYEVVNGDNYSFSCLTLALLGASPR